MRQLATTFILILCFITGIMPVYPAVSGGISYNIPIEYKNLSEEELSSRAETYYAEALNSKKLDDNMSNTLFLYSVLQNMNPKNIEYSIRLGILYDKIKLDKYAKGNFSRAININPLAPEPYFYLGEYYYNRQSYRKALKYYLKSYENGFNTNRELLGRLGDVYKKLGDEQASQKYLEPASAGNSADNPDK